MARVKLVHKLFLGFLTGIVLGFLAFFAVNTFVVTTNAVALRAQAINGTVPANAVLAYDPPWAFPLAAFGFAFIVPVAGIISLDMDERQNEPTAPTQSTSLTILEIGPQLAALGEKVPAIINLIKQAQGQKKTDEGPPGTKQ